MRERLTEPRLRELMSALAREAVAEGRIYLTGGACAVILGWRESTLDVDIQIIPESGALFSAIPKLKEVFRVNVELAAPSDFIPPLPGWRDRSPFIAHEGKLFFHHYDFYSQALAKIERGHELDKADVQNMIARGLVDRDRLLSFFDQIEPDLIRYPAIHPPAFRAAVERTIRRA